MPIAKETLEVLRKELRGETNPRVSSDDVLARFTYSMGLMGVEPDGKAPPTRKLNKAVQKNIAELKLMLLSGRITDAETREATEALVEYVEKYLKMREWKALVLTLDEQNFGLRISPDLARMLILEKSPEEAMRKYKEMVVEAVGAAGYSFKADVISYFQKSVPKKGPEHAVPILESDIEWDTGRVSGIYLFIMSRYEIDTYVKGQVVNIANLALSPNPEYEPVGFRLRYDADGTLRVIAGLSRSHWIPYQVPVELIEKTYDGLLKVTARPDTESVVYGHAAVFVTKNPGVAYSTILKLSPELHRLVHVQQEAYLWILMTGARDYYRHGEVYDTPMAFVMEKTDLRSDPFSKPLR